MLLAGVDQYAGLQNTTQPIVDAQEAKPVENKDVDTSKKDKVFISSQYLKLQVIADDYDVGNITFKQVNHLKSDLFSNGLIPIKATDALTIATQSQPDNRTFNLSQVTKQFYEMPGNLIFKPLLSPMQALFANLEAMHQSEMAA